MVSDRILLQCSLWNLSIIKTVCVCVYVCVYVAAPSALEVWAVRSKGGRGMRRVAQSLSHSSSENAVARAVYC
jgi:hypothetical protein